MLVIAPQHLKAVVDATETAWPEEACGLLVGRREPALVWRVTRIEPARNVAPDRRRAFEVDPGLRIGLERELRGGEDRIVGVYHSHPEGPVWPSAVDRAMVFEPELLWLVVSLWQGQAVETAAYMPGAGGFRPVALVANGSRSGDEFQ